MKFELACSPVELKRVLRAAVKRLLGRVEVKMQIDDRRSNGCGQAGRRTGSGLCFHGVV